MQNVELIRCCSPTHPTRNAVPCDWQVDDEILVEIRSAAPRLYPAMIAEIYDLRRAWAEPFREAIFHLPFNQPK